MYVYLSVLLMISMREARQAWNIVKQLCSFTEADAQKPHIQLLLYNVLVDKCKSYNIK